ncbi:MAG: YlbG family protein [Paenibacillaceae bacterium]
MHERMGVIVWVNDIKSARGLEKYGSVHYISKRMKYVVMYMDASQYESTITQLSKFPYVKEVERSYRTEIKTEYSSSMPDKAKSYTY